MSGNLSQISNYQQTNQVYKNNQKNKTENSATSSKTKANSKITTTEYKPISYSSSLVPTNTKDYGMAIGDVQLSDTAKDYYDKLKSKFHNMDFIVVDSDVKDQVAKNAASYGNANKPVVLIDEEKLERMATDESFRKKYEGIIAMSQTQLAQAKNSLASSGAKVANFGINVGADGTLTYFASLEKSSEQQTKQLEKMQEAKKEAKIKEKKAAKKEAEEARIEKAREKNKANKSDKVDDKDEINEELNDVEDKEYVTIEAKSFDELVNLVSNYAYENSANNILSPAEQSVGTAIDFKG